MVYGKNEQARFIAAVSEMHQRAQRLFDVTCGDNWDADLETAVADFVLAAAGVRNRYDELA